MRRAKSASARPRVWSPASQVEGVSHHSTKASRLAAYYQRLQQMQHAAQVARLTAAEGEAVLPKSPPPKAPRGATGGSGASVEKLAGWGGDGTDGTYEAASILQFAFARVHVLSSQKGVCVNVCMTRTVTMAHPWGGVWKRYSENAVAHLVSSLGTKHPQEQ